MKREWILKGIYTINDMLDSDGGLLTLVEFEQKYQIRSNFLEFGIVCQTIKKFLQFRERPTYSIENPADCFLNVVLRKDTKGVSTIYSLLLNKNPSIIDKVCAKWNDKIGETTSIFEFRKSFSKSSMFDDIYLRYIQFRTLHRRFFTNNILHKMRIKDSPLCNFCVQKEDSNEHMLIECEIVQTLWHNIEEWISAIGVIDYSITNSVIILGELQKSFWLNAIILITKNHLQCSNK